MRCRRCQKFNSFIEGVERPTAHAPGRFPSREALELRGIAVDLENELRKRNSESSRADLEEVVEIPGGTACVGTGLPVIPVDSESPPKVKENPATSHGCPGRDLCAVPAI